MVVCWEIVGRGLYVSFCLPFLSLCVPGKIAGLSSHFDTVDHSILISKLSAYGIRRASIEWF